MVSLLRHRVGPRVFKAVHWLTYLLWPVALLHALGTGTDAASLWMTGLAVACFTRRDRRRRLAAAPVVRRPRPRTALPGRSPDDHASPPVDTRRLLGRRAGTATRPGCRSRPLLGAGRGAPGLTGRGGAGFPTAIKLRAVAEGAAGPVVVGNAMEGEPLSRKDAVLLTRAPAPGRRRAWPWSGGRCGARQTVLALGPEITPRRGRGGRARVRRVRGRPARRAASSPARSPRWSTSSTAVPRCPATRWSGSPPQGVDGRPTLVLNAETLAQLALARAARRGLVPRGRHRRGPRHVAVHASAAPSTRPGVVEAPRGTRLRDVLAAGACRWTRSRCWSAATTAPGCPARPSTPRSPARELCRAGAAVGAGVLHVLGPRPCPIRVAADIAAYLAGESAAQCGPCINGLPRMAEALQRLADRRPGPRAAGRDRPDAAAGHRTGRLRPPRRHRPDGRQHDAGLRRPRRPAPRRALRARRH